MWSGKAEGVNENHLKDHMQLGGSNGSEASHGEGRVAKDQVYLLPWSNQGGGRGCGRRPTDARAVHPRGVPHLSTETMPAADTSALCLLSCHFRGEEPLCAKVAQADLVHGLERPDGQHLAAVHLLEQGGGAWGRGQAGRAWVAFRRCRRWAAAAAALTMEAAH